MTTLWGLQVPLAKGGDDYYAAYRNSYFKLYRLYHILNHYCWQDRLPVCVLSLERRKTTDAILAYAAADACITPRQSMHLIKFLLTYCVQLSEHEFISYMLHEMVHIEQYCQQGQGGHGEDFEHTLKRTTRGDNAPLERAKIEIAGQGLTIVEDLRQMLADKTRRQIFPAPVKNYGDVLAVDGRKQELPGTENDFKFYLYYRTIITKGMAK